MHFPSDSDSEFLERHSISESLTECEQDGSKSEPATEPDCSLGMIAGVLHFVHGEGAVASTPGTARQGPSARDRVTRDGSDEVEIVAAGRAGFNTHPKFAGNVAIEIAGKGKGTAFGFAGNEAGRVGGEREIADAQRSIPGFNDRGIEGKDLSVVSIHYSGGPIAVNVGAILAARTTTDQGQTHQQQDG